MSDQLHSKTTSIAAPQGIGGAIALDSRREDAASMVTTDEVIDGGIAL